LATDDMSRRLVRREAWGGGETSSPEAPLPAQMGKIYAFLKGLHAAHVIDIGVRLGLFQALAGAGGLADSSALAEATELNPEYAAIWCETACALELLDCAADGRYRFAPHMDLILGEPESNYYLGGFPQAHFQVARDYARYPELFQTGGVVPYQQHDELFFGLVAEATRTLPRMFIDAVLPRLPSIARQLEAGGQVLDVGCGGGYAVVEFASRYPGTTCVGIDVEELSVALAEKLIRARNLQDRVKVRLVDGATLPDDLVGNFDLVTQFLVLHEIHPMLKTAVIEACAAALRPGGHFLIFDEAYPETAAELRHPLKVYAVMAQWYESTWGNTINTRGEIRRLLRGGGLTVIDETELSRFYIVVARKDD
jgi:SAM-dependent methyltransferase